MGVDNVEETPSRHVGRMDSNLSGWFKILRYFGDFISTDTFYDKGVIRLYLLLYIEVMIVMCTADTSRVGKRVHAKEWK